MTEPKLEDLTKRELGVVKVLVETGGSNYELALQLCVTQQTIKFHMTNIMRKLGMYNRTQVAVFYMAAQQGAEVTMRQAAKPEPNRCERCYIRDLARNARDTDLTLVRVVEQEADGVPRGVYVRHPDSGKLVRLESGADLLAIVNEEAAA